MIPFVAFKYNVSQTVWLLVNFILLSASIIFLLKAMNIGRRELRITPLKLVLFILIIFNFTPLIEVFLLGQLTIIVFFLICMAFFYFKRGRDILCGVMLALATCIKVSPVLFVVYFLFKRQWRVFLSSVLGICIIVSFSIPITGHSVWKEYVTTIIPLMLSYTHKLAGSLNICGFFTRLLVPNTITEAIWPKPELASVLIWGGNICIVGCSFFFLRRPMNRYSIFDFEFSLMIILYMLVGSYTREHYMTLLLLTFLLGFNYLFETLSSSTAKNPYIPQLFLFAIFLSVAYAVIALQYDYRHELFRSGFLILLFSMKFYGVALLWIAHILLLRHLPGIRSFQEKIT